MAETAWTIGALLQWTAKFLDSKRLDSPRLDAEVLLAHVTGCRRIELYTRSDEVAGDELRTRYRELVRRRVDGCPVAYLVGSREFFLLTFEVTPDVLIPRPDTETLVAGAIDRLKSRIELRILDVGAGSGCIAVSVAHQLRSARVVATDVSTPALDVARRNAFRHGVSDRIELRSGDLFGPVAGATFDAILSNPPYIPTGDIAGLAHEVRDHEPRQALDGGADGLDVIRRLVAGAPPHMKPDGWLLIEIGAGQEAAALEIVRSTDGLIADKTLPDRAGMPRVIVARRAQ